MFYKEVNVFANDFFIRRSVVFVSAVICTFLWGSSYPAIKTGYALWQIEANDIASQMVFAGLRFLLAGVFLLVLIEVIGRKKETFQWYKFRQVSLLGVMHTSFQYVFFYIGLAFTTGVKASIMNATGTFFSVILAHFIYTNDRLSQRKVLGCLLGFCGVFMVNFSDSLLTFDFSLAGEGAIIFAAFILAAASIYGKKISQSMDPMQMTAWQLTIGGLVLLILGAASDGKVHHFSFDAGLILVYLAFLSSVAFALWSVLLKHNPIGMVTIFNFLVPVFGTMLSAVFLHESILEWKNLMALILVCLGIYLVTTLRKKLFFA